MELQKRELVAFNGDRDNATARRKKKNLTLLVVRGGDAPDRQEGRGPRTAHSVMISETAEQLSVGRIGVRPC
jgi:hypothetical protein